MIGAWSRFAIAIFSAALIGGGAEAQVRQTESGAVQGITGFGITEFRDIPYAAPPVGKLRWRPPAPPLVWTGTRDASNYGPACEQSGSPFPVSEDCLTLNIYEPAGTGTTATLPVMIWIHGGGFISGSPREVDGTSLAERGGVIIVTLEYRLGYFGFLAHPALSAADPNHVSGNYGILDQQAAIAWVRRNIANFGGDPRHLTIFGESAGGQSVVDQLISPSVGPLSAAIIQSGAYSTSLPTLAQGEQAGETAATALGCPDQSLSCLYGLSATKLAQALNPLSSLGGVSAVLDGLTLPLPPAQAFAQGKFQHIPIINGSNHDEYRIFVGVERWLAGNKPMTADQYAAQVKNQFGSFAANVLAEYPAGHYAIPDYAYAAVITDVAFACNTPLLNGLMAKYTQVWQYELADPHSPVASGPTIKGFSYGSPHSADLSFLFPSYNPIAAFHPDGPPPLTPAELKLRGQMQDAWLNLARYGTPRNPSGALWPAFTTSSPAVMSFYPPQGGAVLSFYGNHHCKFWWPILLAQAGLPTSGH
jgi:para-nitrobenzyl esterase